MATCPNRNLESWQNLVAARGEEVAYYLWDKYDGNVPDSESKENIVNAGLKSISALQSKKAITLFNTLEKNKVTGDAFWNKIQADLQIPKSQIDLLKKYDTTDRETLIANMLGDYSFAVEINISTQKDIGREVRYDESSKVPYTVYFTETGIPSKSFRTKEEADAYMSKPSAYYSNLTVPGGTNYTENEIATPAITPAIKGHAQFATDKGIGWFRSDDQVIGGEIREVPIEFRDMVPDEPGTNLNQMIGDFSKTKTRRILEMQSDLFQKGREKEDLVFGEIEEQPTFMIEENQYEPDFYAEEYNYRVRAGEIKPTDEEVKSNQFLQLLNKDNNWVTFFTKAIIQDSIKKGYENVLFPKGDTASKVEGHTTLEEFKKQKEDRIKQLEKTQVKYFGEQFTSEYEPTGNITSWYDTEQEAEDAAKKEYDNYQIGQTNGFDNSKEIAQLKQELERVEKEGFGALKPIYNFYENTVGNILKKQGYDPSVITDEYGNQWYKVGLDRQRDVRKILFQIKGTETSKASPKTIAAIKDFVKRIGVDINSLEQIVVDGVRQDANGAALIMQKLIQVVRGTEASSLPEEAMHFAVEIIEQTNPKLFNKMLSEINNYRILNKVISDYGTDPLYQTKDGKPDIRKLKKEAIAKVLAETVIKRAEGTTEKPENLAKVETWWDAIVNFFKNLFIKSGFDEAAMQVLSGEFEGTAQDLRNDEVYLQESKPIQQRMVDKIKAVAATIESLGGEGYKINGRKVKLRVTDLSKTWLDNRFADNNLTKSDFQKAVDDLKREKGDAGHLDMKHMFQNYFLDSEGKFIVDPADRPDDSRYVSRLDPKSKKLYDILKKSTEQRLQQFHSQDPNMVFLVETPIYDPKRDLAGTVDFMAIDSNGKVNILDWKFMDQNVDKFEDIPWYKVQSWNKQMGNYKAILRDAYNFNFTGTEQTQMVPIRAVYSGADAKLGIKPQLIDLQVGNINLKDETRAYLLPVGLPEQRTGNRKIDELIKKLNEVYEILSSKKVTDDQRAAKNEQLNALYSAIRQLQVRQNVKPLIKQAGLINKEIQSVIDDYNENWQGKDPKSFTTKQKNDLAARIMSYEDSLSVYTKLSTDLKSIFSSDMSEGDKKLWEQIRQITENANELESELEDVRNRFAEDIIAKSKNVLDFLKPEKVVRGFARWFGLTSTTQLTSAELLYKLANEAYAKAAMMTTDEGNILLKLKTSYDSWAKKKGLSGKDYFNSIKKKDKNELIDEFNPEFYKELRKRITDRDFAWIKENIDVDALKAELARVKQEEYSRIERKTRFVGGVTEEEMEEATYKEIAFEKQKADQLYNISAPDSAGWLLYDTVKKFPKREKWESTEWKDLNKAENKPAKDFYDYIKKRNEYYESIGYINGRQARVFLPFIRKTLMEKLVMGGQVKLGEDLLRQVTISEGDVGFGQINPITKEPIYNIPKYFTSDTGEEVSDDLFRNMTLLNEMAIRYEYLSDIEDQMRLIIRTEGNKEAIKTSYFGKTKYKEDGTPETTSDNSDNTKLVRDMMEAIVYGHKYVESETFDQLLGSISGFGKKLNDKLGVKIFPENYDNMQISLNKSITQLNNLFQLKTLGLNPLSAISNFLGGSFQSIINAGTYFTKSEFVANEFLLATRMNGTDAKKYLKLLEYFLPLTENYNAILAKKLSSSKFSQESVQDFLMSLMRHSDQYVQTVNFFSYLDNSVVIDGRVENAREYLRKTDKYKNIYNVSAEERTKLQNEFEEDVRKMIDENGIIKNATLKGDELSIAGIDRMSDSVIELRRKVQKLTKDALGNLSADDVRQINLNIYGKSFMMFKNWIPRLVDVRFGNLKYNNASDAYEWGRSRMMFRVLSLNIIKSIDRLVGIASATDEGVAYMKELYEKKKTEYEKETGKTLRMDEAEFIDLVRKNVKDQAVDLVFYLTLMALYIGVKAIPPDDEDPATKNAYRYMVRAIDKVKDEVAYFYDPTNLAGTVSSGIFPSISYLTNFKKLLTNFGTEMYAIGVGDEALEKKNQVVKYLLKGFPITSQFDSFLLMFYPDLAKDLGMKAQTQARPTGM